MRIQDLFVPPGAGEVAFMGTAGAVLKAAGDASGGRLSVVEHPVAPRGLIAPRHTHSREDEYSYVVSGRVGFELGGEVVVGEAGAFAIKPRGVPHAFWNAGDEPALVLEIISPAGFEAYFAEIGRLMQANDMASVGPLLERFGLSMEFESVGELAARHGLDLGPGGPPPQV